MIKERKTEENVMSLTVFFVFQMLGAHICNTSVSGIIYMFIKHIALRYCILEVI